jgi:hypothetical protein
VVLAAAAAGRRTEYAFPRLVATHGFDTLVYSTLPVPQLAKLPQVSAVTKAVGPDNGQATCACTHPINPNEFGVIVIEPGGISPFKLVSGHLPNPLAPDQVVASFSLQQDYGLHLGSVIHVPFYALSQLSAYNNATGALPRPTGPNVTFHVVGFEAADFEFPSGGSPSYSLYATQAFARTVLPRTAFAYAYFLRLRHGAADLPRLTAEAHSLAGLVYADNLDAQVASVEASIHPQAVGWWILAALAALVGLAVVGQALARQSIVESEDYPAMAALGADRRQLAALAMTRNAMVALAGALGALAVATALSPIAPLGEARNAETSTGVTFDAFVLLLGVLAIVAVVLALGAWPALRAARTSRPDDRAIASRPSVVVAGIAAAGAPPSAVVGVRNALERRSGGATVPVGSALLGTVLAVVALCGTAVFGASLSHLTATPRLYGDPFQLNFSDPGSRAQPDPVLLNSLEHNRKVTGITEGFAIEMSVNRVTAGGIAGTALRGPFLLSTVSGHLPSGSGDGQIGLGATTMHQVGAHVGSIVHVIVSSPSGRQRTVPLRVVAQISFPVLSGIVSLGSGVAMTISGYEAAVCPPGPRQASCRQAVVDGTNGGILASVVPGAQGQAVINHYLDAYRASTALAVAPLSLINFGEAVNFPLIFGAMLAVFGAATLLHLLVVSVSRRRREIGLLKVLGFVNGQVASGVAWQATTLALVGIVVGVPLGLVIGQAVWKAFASNLGAVPVSVVPIWVIAVLVAGVLVVANLIAVAPALVATRSKPGELLRTS